MPRFRPGRAWTALGSLRCRVARWSAALRRRRSLSAAGRLQEATQEEAQQAVEAERQRLARDLHDGLGHSLSLMVLQAGAAARVLRHDPERAAVALEQVDALGRQAVDELRTLLGLLGTDPVDEPVGTHDLTRLVAHVRAAGLPVSLRQRGARPDGLHPGTDLAVYRVVQESLTNALRHGDTRRATTVDLTWQLGDVSVEVANHCLPGTDAAPDLSRHRGVDGMHARAASVGGRLSACEDHDRVYRVRAVLPTRAPAAAPAGLTLCCDAAPLIGAAQRSRRRLPTAQDDHPGEPLAEQRAA